MDGRAHPPDYALHTAQGFSTGKWEGDILTVYTTHLKEGWIRRNGVPRSDRAAVMEHFIRHDDGLTLMTIITDPIYLTEPMVRSREYEFRVGGDIGPYPCEAVEEVVRAKGVIPHHLPGTNPFLKEFAEDTPWIHLDIAGTAWMEDAKPWIAKGPSGIAVRSLVEFARGFTDEAIDAMPGSLGGPSLSSIREQQRTGDKR